MARADHQPWEKTPDRPDRSVEEWSEACGSTITFVLAFGQHAGAGCDEKSIAAAVEAACQACMPGVYVLADDAHREAVLAAMRGINFKKYKTTIEFMGYDEQAAIPLTHDAADFEVCEIPYGLIATMQAVADSVSDEYDSVVAIGAGPTGITCHHLYELCVDHMRHPDAGVVASWIMRLRRPPYLFTRDFMDGLKGSPLTQLREDGTRAVPHVGIRDHVFGEEKLASPAPAPQQVTQFLDGCTMSALEAVQLAKHSLDHPDEELHSPNQKLSLLGPAKIEPLNKSDEQLVKMARAVIAAGDKMSEAEAAELMWADEFGARNKLDFPLLNDRAHAGKLVYLDSAATTQRVDVALRAQHDYDLHENANVYRGAYSLSAQSTLTFNDARKKLEDFIGAERRTTAFTMNTSAAVNLVAQAWGERNIGAGDLIVCGLADHHSNTLPFAMLAERKGAQVEYVPFDDNGRMDQKAYAALLARKPKLVCLTQIGNMFGIVEPVKEMAAAAHEVGARVLLDAAQSFPHVKIDVRDLGVDWVVMSAHKAYGPMGLGALWMSDAAFAEMDPLGGGGGVVSHVSTESYYLRPKSLQYEPGTPPVSQAVGWAAAIDYMEALGMENIARHGAALTRYAVRGLQRIDGVNVVGDHSKADGQTGLVSFAVRSVAPADTAAFLGSLGVAIRSGGHCALPVHAEMGMIGTGRISIGVHTTRDDIDAALTAIELCRRVYEM